MNNWYNRINGIPQVQPMSQFQNPLQQMNYIMNAMRNPVAFIQDQFPDVPENIRSNPDSVLEYLQRTRGAAFTQQMQQISGMCGRR